MNMFGRGNTSNHGSSWSGAMDSDLLRLFAKGKSIKQLANDHFFRTERAIRLRLQHLGYYMEVDKDMSKAPNRYLVLGVKNGHVRRLASRRGCGPEETVVQALRVDETYGTGHRGQSDCLILVSIRDASDAVGAPLNADVEVIEREAPVLPYRLVNLQRQAL